MRFHSEPSESTWKIRFMKELRKFATQKLKKHRIVSNRASGRKRRMFRLMPIFRFKSPPARLNSSIPRLYLYESTYKGVSSIVTKKFVRYDRQIQLPSSLYSFMNAKPTMGDTWRTFCYRKLDEASKKGNCESFARETVRSIFTRAAIFASQF